ncbi:MAG: hypothetical protein ACJ8H8_06065 [Geminicoccaceae bacterium]
MAHISGHDRSQALLFPESVDDYVDPDNPVRFIDAFVDGQDLSMPFGNRAWNGSTSPIWPFKMNWWSMNHPKRTDGSATAQATPNRHHLGSP